MPKRLYTLSPTPCTGASQDSDEITYLNHLLRKTLACRLLLRRKRYLPAGPEAVTPISVFWPNTNTRTTGAVMGGSQSVPATASKVARRTKRPTGTPSWSFMPKLHDSVLERVQPLRINFHNVDDSIRPLRSRTLHAATPAGLAILSLRTYSYTERIGTTRGFSIKAANRAKHFAGRRLIGSRISRGWCID
jgi:hypothetical protein